MSPILMSPPSSPSIGVLIACASTGSAVTAKPAAIAAAMKLRRSIGTSGTRLLKWSFFSRSCGRSFSMALLPVGVSVCPTLTARHGVLFLDQGQSRRKPVAGALLCSFGKHRLRKALVARMQGAVEQDQHKKIALGLAASQVAQLRSRGREPLGGARIVARAPGDHALAQGAAEALVDSSGQALRVQRRHFAERQRLERVDKG